MLVSRNTAGWGEWLVRCGRTSKIIRVRGQKDVPGLLEYQKLTYALDSCIVQVFYDD